MAMAAVAAGDAGRNTSPIRCVSVTAVLINGDLWRSSVVRGPKGAVHGCSSSATRRVWRSSFQLANPFAPSR